jgi:uncharacterized membrane protein YqjE
VDSVVNHGALHSAKVQGSAARANGARDVEPSEGAFLEPMERVFKAMKRMSSSYAMLGVLDARRAALQLAWLIGAGIFITVLVVTAWLSGVVALAVLMFGKGMSWPAVLGIAGLINVAGAAIVAWRVKHVFEEQPFSATLRQLKAGESAVEQ